MKDERRWNRGAWLTLAVAIGWFIICLAYALYVYHFPQDGWSYPSDASTRNMFTAEVNMTGEPSVLRAGDRVTAINGQPIVKDQAPSFPPDLQVGQTLRYTVERDGRVVDLEVPLVTLGADSWLRHAFGAARENPREPIVSLVAILVVGFAFFSRPGNLGARYLFIIFSYYFVSSWFGFSVSPLYQSTFSFAAQYVYQIMGYSWYWAFFASLILMPLAFPVVKAPLRRFPRLLPAVIYGFALTTTVILAYWDLKTRAPVWSSLAFACFALYVALTVVSIFGTLVHNWLTVGEPVARAQLRWMTLGMGLGMGIPFVLMLVIVIQRGTLSGAGAGMLWLFLLLPICLAVAITRYHLFDIDVIIRRTLVYAIVTVLLGLVFYGSVLLLQRLFTTLTGQTSPVAIVASTLVIAALFSPLRARVQAFVDRRFYRRKYDAQQVLAQFAVVARDETDVDRLAGQLTSAVETTLQPARIGVWMQQEDAA
jgi:hypothetical protein